MTAHVRFMPGSDPNTPNRTVGGLLAPGRSVLGARLAVALAVVVCGVLGVGVTSAFAVLSYPFDGELAPAGGSFGFLEAGSVAVDDSNGDTYVADSASGTVDVFVTASGAQLPSLDASLAPPPHTFGGGQVEVAANNGTGDVYVLDSTDNVVDVFDGAGGYVCQITGSASPSATECNGAAGSQTSAGGFSDPGGIAVDQATGDVYVVDAQNSVVDIFSSAGAYVRDISLSSIPSGFGNLNKTYTREIAVDDFNGEVFVADSGIDGVYVFNATGGYETTWTGANTPAESFGGGYVSVAADDASGDVYVLDSQHGVVDVFGSSGGYLTQFSRTSFARSVGTAVDQASGRVYVSDVRVVDIFGPKVIVPGVATGAALNVQPTSATLGGAANPAGVQLSDCRFQYGTSATYGQSVPCVPAAGSIPADSSDHAVSADLTGLQPGTVYHYRLVAANENDAGTPSVGEDATFETLPRPSIDSAAAVNVTSTSVDLTASIDPRGLDSTYRFEYGTSAAYGASVPVPDGEIAAGSGRRAVTRHVSGLQANTTYHWRVVAQNANGITTGADHTFIYDTSGEGLPDNRAYEMVTPPRKNGALIGVVFIGDSPHVSEDGSRVISPSVQCFAGSGSCSPDRNLEGDPFAFTRTDNGWVTTALAPAAIQFDINTSIGVSADTGAALFSAPTAPAGGDEWVARGADGSLVDIGPVTPPSAGALGPAGAVVAATRDFSHIVYYFHFLHAEDQGQWPFDATRPSSREMSLYEYVGAGNAAPMLVGVSGGAGSTDLISTCGTLPANGGLVGRLSLSADGGVVYFMAVGGEGCSGSGVNAGVAVPANALYARIDGSRTVLISGRPPLDCTGVCLSSPAGDALFEGASRDGSKAFFTSTQQLTNSASEDNQRGDEASGCQHTTGVNGCNLYEYDFASPAGHNLVAISAGDTSGDGPQVQSVTAVSSDGSHVYFLAKGVLTAAANSQGEVPQAGGENLYLFERDAQYPQGRVVFIATLPPSDEELIVTSRAPVSGFEFDSANVTPDGRFLVFMSHGRLTPDDTSGMQQVFRYDAQTGELVRVSVGERGFNDDGNAGSGNASIVRAAAAFPRTDPTMSHDGAFVFFESPVALTPRALNDVPVGTFAAQQNYAENVYEWHEGQVHLISDGSDTSALSAESDNASPTEGSSSVRLLGSDATGANVFFWTADRLVGRDTDTQLDFYDARVCTASDPCVVGSSAPVSPCVGEGCRGVPGAPPALAAPVSASFSGAGNLAGEAKAVVKTKKKAKPTRRAHGKKAKKRKGRRRALGKRGRAKGSVRSTRRGR
jgi:DNA-binding beta-propeller fold protein YncE